MNRAAELGVAPLYFAEEASPGRRGLLAERDHSRPAHERVGFSVGRVHGETRVEVRAFEPNAFIAQAGAILAAAALTAAPELLRGLGEWRMILYSLLLIVTMWLRPQGLLGRRELGIPHWRWRSQRLGPRRAPA